MPSFGRARGNCNPRFDERALLRDGLPDAPLTSSGPLRTLPKTTLVFADLHGLL